MLFFDDPVCLVLGNEGPTVRRVDRTHSLGGRKRQRLPAAVPLAQNDVGSCRAPPSSMFFVRCWVLIQRCTALSARNRQGVGRKQQLLPMPSITRA